MCQFVFIEVYQTFKKEINDGNFMQTPPLNKRGEITKKILQCCQHYTDNKTFQGHYKKI